MKKLILCIIIKIIKVKLQNQINRNQPNGLERGYRLGKSSEWANGFHKRS